MDEAQVKDIARTLIDYRIDAEREIFTKALRVGLYVAGFSITVLVAVTAFFGFQRFQDVREEALRDARSQVTVYLEAKVKEDGYAVVDRQYGEALIRTLRVGALSGNEVELTLGQANRITDAVLSADSEDGLVDEALEVIQSALQDDEVIWWPRIQARLVKEAVLSEAFSEQFPNRRESIVDALSKVGNEAALRSLRTIVAKEELSSDAVESILNMERRLQPEQATDEIVIEEILRRDPTSGVAAAARALLFARYPGSTAAKQVMASADKLSENELRTFGLTMQYLIEDSARLNNTAASETERSRLFVSNVSEIFDKFRDSCKVFAVELGSDEDADKLMGTSKLEFRVLRSKTNLSITCALSTGTRRAQTKLEITVGALTRHVTKSLTVNQSNPSKFAQCIQRWSGVGKNELRVKLIANYPVSMTADGRSEVLVDDKPVPGGRTLGVFELSVVPDPTNKGNLLPALHSTNSASTNDKKPIAFRTLQGFGLSTSVLLTRAVEDSEAEEL